MQYGGIEKNLASLIERAVNEVFTARGIQPLSSLELRSEIEIPKDKSHGDLSTNIAMRGARIAKISPLDLATQIKTQLDGMLPELHGAIERIEVKQPGFINFFSLMFSDFSSVVTYWQSFAMILLETLPALSLALFLAVFIYCLEVFIALLQAYIFILLSAVFIGQMYHPDH